MLPLWVPSSFVPTDRSLHPEGLHQSRGVAASGFPPLRNIPHCCLPQESGPCLSSSVSVHPLRPDTRHSLGEPLPHQQADRTQADPLAKNFPPQGVSSINHRFQWLSQTKGHITYALLTRAPLIHFQQAKSFIVRLACIRHAASVHSEPGSNSP